MFQQDIGNAGNVLMANETSCLGCTACCDCDLVSLVAVSMRSEVLAARAHFERSVVPGLALPTEEQIGRFTVYQRIKDDYLEFLGQYPCMKGEPI